MGDIYFKLIEKISINRQVSVYWYKHINSDEYQVIIMLYNREIYNMKLDRHNYSIYYKYINERVKFLVNGEILNKEYSMILIDGVMYKTLDNGFSHFKELIRNLVPIGDSSYTDRRYRFDLVMDCTLRAGEVFDKEDLVYHNGIFYYNGDVVSTIRDFERDGIEFEDYDLLQGITEEHLKYLGLYNKLIVKNYITRDTIIKIDRW